MACGGPIGDVGIHAIDALRFLLEQEVVAVSTLAYGRPTPDSATERELEESAAITLQFSGAVLGSVHVSFRATYRTLIEVVGEDGVLTAESGFTVDRPVTIVHHAGAKIVSEETVSNGDAYSRMLDAFSAAVEGAGRLRVRARMVSRTSKFWMRRFAVGTAGAGSGFARDWPSGRLRLRRGLRGSLPLVAHTPASGLTWRTADSSLRSE